MRKYVLRHTVAVELIAYLLFPCEKISKAQDQLLSILLPTKNALFYISINSYHNFTLSVLSIQKISKFKLEFVNNHWTVFCMVQKPCNSILHGH